MGFKPLLRSARNKNNSAKLIFGGGINTDNTPFTIGMNEGTYLRNVSSRVFPALATSEGYTAYATALTTPNALGQRNNANLHAVDGTTWKYWNGSSYTNVKTSMTNAVGQFAEFCKADGTLYTVYSNGTDRYIWETGAPTSLSASPATALFVSHKQRLYWALGKAITCSALDDPTDYSTAGVTGYHVIIMAELQGGATAIRAFDNHVIVWGEYGMYQLFGTDVADFSLNKVRGTVGAVGQRATCIADTRLFFLGYDGVYQYDTDPVLISGKVEHYIDNINWTYKNLICSGASSKYVYFSVPYGTSQTTNNITLVYDLGRGQWYVQDRAYRDFVRFAGELYGVSNAGVIYKLEDGTSWAGTAMEWDFVTPAFSADSIKDYLSLSAIDVVVDMPGNSNMLVSYSEDIEGVGTEDWTAIAEVESSEYVKGHRIHVPVSALYDKKFFRLRFSGQGECVLHFVQMEYRRT